MHYYRLTQTQLRNKRIFILSGWRFECLPGKPIQPFNKINIKLFGLQNEINKNGQKKKAETKEEGKVMRKRSDSTKID